MMINNFISEEKKQKRTTAPLKMIENLKARTLSYKKRKECVLKKTRELAILCDVQACAICIGPDGRVKTWPENSTQVKDVISEYNEYVKLGKKGKSVGNFSNNDSGGSILEGKKDSFFVENLSSRKGIENIDACLESKLREVNYRIELLKREKTLATGCNNVLSGLEMMGSNSFSQGNETDYDNISMVKEDFYTGPVRYDYREENEIKYRDMLLEESRIINENSQIIDSGFTNWYEDPRFNNGGDFDFLVEEIGFRNNTYDLTCY